MKNILSIHCAVCFEFRPPINIHTFNIYDNYHPVHLHKLHTTTIICFSIKFKFITTRKRSLGQGNIFTGVCLSTGGGGACSRGVPAPWGVPAPGGCLVQEGGCSGGCLLWGVPAPGGGGAWSGGCLVWGCLVETPPQDGYCCGWYTSYWNAFL